MAGIQKGFAQPGRTWSRQFNHPYTARTSPPIPQVPIFGVTRAPWDGVNSTVGPLRGIRIYNNYATGVPSTWPGPGGATISGIVPAAGQLISFRPDPTQVLSGSLDSALGTFFSSMPAGSYVTSWHEGEKDDQSLGYSQATLIAMHTRIYGIFQNNAPAACSYGQIVGSSSAFTGNNGFPLGPWVCTPANGGSLLDFYGIDLYPTSFVTTFADCIGTVMSTLIAAGVPQSGPWTISEVAPNLNWRASKPQWWTDGWSVAQAIGAKHFLPFFSNDAGDATWFWPTTDVGELQVLQGIAALSRGDPRAPPAVVPARSTTAPFVSSSNSTGLTTTFTSNPVAGSKVVVVVNAGQAATLAVSDNGATPGVFRQDAAALNQSGLPSVFVFSADNITLPGSGTYAVSVTKVQTGTLQIGAVSYTGLQAGPPAATSAMIGTSANPAGNPVIPPDANSVFIGAFFSDSAQNPQSILPASPEFTLAVSQTNGTSVPTGEIDDLLATTPASRAGGWTLSDAPDWTAIMVNYGAFTAQAVPVPGANAVFALAPTPTISALPTLQVTAHLAGAGSVSGGVLTATNSFEGGTDGVTISNANSGGLSGLPFDIINTGAGCTVAFNAANAAHGGMAALIQAGVTATSISVEWSTSMATATSEYFRLYVKIPAVPSGISPRFYVLRSATSVVCALFRITPAGVINIESGGSGTPVSVYTFTNTVNVNSYFRVEGFVTGDVAAGVMSCSLYNSMDSTTPTETSGLLTGLNTTGPIAQRHAGKFDSSASFTTYIDEWAIGTSPIGPWTPGAPSTVNATAALTGLGIAGPVPPIISVIANLAGAGVVSSPDVISVTAAIAGHGAAGATPAIGVTSTIAGAGQTSSGATIGVTASLTGAGVAGIPGVINVTTAVAGQSIAALVVPIIGAPAAITGTGQASAGPLTSVTATVTGAGADSSLVIISVTANISGAGVVTGAAQAIWNQTATLTGAGVIAATPAIGVVTALAGQSAAGTIPAITVLSAVAGLGTVSAPPVISVTATLLAAGSMAIPGPTLTNNAEGVPLGATVTTGNSGGVSGSPFDSVSIGALAALTADNTHSVHGAQSYEFVTGSPSANCILIWSTSLNGTYPQVWYRMYVWLTAYSATQLRVVSLRNGGTYQGGPAINNSGKVVLLNATGATVKTSTTSVPLNQWFRLEGFVIGDPTVGQLECKLFTTTPDSIAPDETVTSTAVQNTGGTINRVDFGDPASVVSFTFWGDDPGAGTSGYLGPSPQTGVTVTAGAGTVSSPVIISVTAQLTGTGAITASSTGTISATTTLTGAGIAGTVPTISVTALLAGAGIAASSDQILIPVTASIAGAGSDSAPPIISVTAGLAGAGLCGAGASGTGAVNAQLAGLGIAGATPTIGVAAAIAGQGTVNLAPVITVTASIAGAGQMALVPPAISVVVSLAGAGIAGPVQPIISVRSLLTSAGIVSAATIQTITAQLAALGIVSETPVISVTAGIAGAGSCTGSTTGTGSAGAALTGAGIAGAVPTIGITTAIAGAGIAGSTTQTQTLATAAIAGTGIASSGVIISVGAILTGAGIAGSPITLSSTAAIAGSSTITDTLIISVAAGIAGSGICAAAPSQTMSPTTAITGTGIAGATPTIGVVALTSGAGAATAAASVSSFTINVTAAITGSGLISTPGSVALTARLSAAAQMQAIVTLRALAALAGQGVLTALGAPHFANVPATTITTVGDPRDGTTTLGAFASGTSSTSDPRDGKNTVTAKASGTATVGRV